MNELRIATRRSRLAMAQARWVARRLTSLHPGLSVELVEVTTTGDVDRTSPVATLTEVGAFVRAIQQAVLDGRAEVAVHSCKDLPVSGPDALEAVYPKRDAPWDVLCGSTLGDLRPGARVGTGSPRRTAQLRALRPDVAVEDIRGNVETRLAKVDAGEFDAVVLAEAGLRRLDIDGRADHRFSLTEMVPAPGQAALAVEAMAESEALDLIKAISDAETDRAVRAERAVLARTGAGCRSALGVLAGSANGSIELTGFVEDENGPRRATGLATDTESAVSQLIEGLNL